MATANGQRRQVSRPVPRPAQPYAQLRRLHTRLLVAAATRSHGRERACVDASTDDSPLARQSFPRASVTSDSFSGVVASANAALISARRAERVSTQRGTWERPLSLVHAERRAWSSPWLARALHTCVAQPSQAKDRRHTRMAAVLV